MEQSPHPDAYAPGLGGGALPNPGGGGAAAGRRPTHTRSEGSVPTSASSSDAFVSESSSVPWGRGVRVWGCGPAKHRARGFFHEAIGKSLPDSPRRGGVSILAPGLLTCAHVVGDVAQGRAPSCTMCSNNDGPETKSTSGSASGCLLDFVFAPCVVVEQIVCNSPGDRN